MALFWMLIHAEPKSQSNIVVAPHPNCKSAVHQIFLCASIKWFFVVFAFKCNAKTNKGFFFSELELCDRSQSHKHHVVKWFLFGLFSHGYFPSFKQISSSFLLWLGRIHTFIYSISNIMLLQMRPIPSRSKTVFLLAVCPFVRFK